MKIPTGFFDSSSVKKEPVKVDIRDIKRRDFKPIEIKVLFACESLPKEKENFFYYKHSVLFDKTLEAFNQVFTGVTQANFLDKFKDLGFYLDDLCGEPVNHLKNGNDKKKRIILRKLYEPDLAKRVELYKPKYVIITPMDIKVNIANVLSLAKIEAPYQELPFPVGSQTNADNYVNKLTDVLHQLIEKEIIGN